MMTLKKAQMAKFHGVIAEGTLLDAGDHLLDARIDAHRSEQARIDARIDIQNEEARIDAVDASNVRFLDSLHAEDSLHAVESLHAEDLDEESDPPSEIRAAFSNASLTSSQ
jgi:hypothetical protein